MRKHPRRAVLDILGWIFLVIGILVLVGPLFQGVLFILVGFYLLYLNSEKFADSFNKFLEKHPHFAEVFEKVDGSVKKFLKKIRLYEKREEDKSK